MEFPLKLHIFTLLKRLDKRLTNILPKKNYIILEVTTDFVLLHPINSCYYVHDVPFWQCEQ